MFIILCHVSVREALVCRLHVEGLTPTGLLQCALSFSSRILTGFSRKCNCNIFFVCFQSKCFKKKCSNSVLLCEAAEQR